MKDKIRLYRLLRVITHHIDNIICCGEWRRVNNYSKTYMGYSKRVLGTCIIVAFRCEDKTDKYPYDLMICLGMENECRKLFPINPDNFNKEIKNVLEIAIEYVDQELK